MESILPRHSGMFLAGIQCLYVSVVVGSRTHGRITFLFGDEESVSADDPYADYQIPSDLIW